jgi:hypothetical protein
MSYILERINNIKVKPIPTALIGAGDNRKIKGYDLFPEPYCNIFIVAKKKSGKTTTIFEIVRRCCTKSTNVIVFCSTINKDKSYKAIKKYCKNKGIAYIGYTSFTEENVLDNILNGLSIEQEPDSDEEEDNPKEIKIKMYDHDYEDEKKDRKDKFISPEYLFIFDDLSSAMRHKTIAKLLKTNRHYKSKVIISSQYLNDLDPQSCKQIDNWLVFPGNPEDKLELIHKYADMSIEFEQFYDIYKDATEEKYNFLYIDTNNDILRKNFNAVYKI